MPPAEPEVPAFQPPEPADPFEIPPTAPGHTPPAAPEVPAFQPPEPADPFEIPPTAPGYTPPPAPEVPAYQPPLEPVTPSYVPPLEPEDPYAIPPSAPGYTPPPEYQQLPGENPYGNSPAFVPPPPVAPGPYATGVETTPPRETEESTGAKRSYFRKDIEGLRAVAVLAVLFFHVGLPLFEGGYVGVDVFYVISGFLITGLLLREGETTGKVNLVRFYARRMRRLLPAALLVIVVTLVLSAIIVTPLRLTEIAGDAAASALYVANFRFAMEATNYLATEAPSPLLHYWTLGVEEQFYLVWPLILLVALRFLPTRLVGLFFLLLAVASFGLSLYWTWANPAWAFFSPTTRAWELAAGALIAIGLLRIPRRAPGITASISVVLGLLLIAASVFVGAILSDLDIGQNEFVNAIFATPDTPYPGVAALLPVFGRRAGDHGRQPRPHARRPLRAGQPGEPLHRPHQLLALPVALADPHPRAHRAGGRRPDHPPRCWPAWRSCWRSSAPSSGSGRSARQARSIGAPGVRSSWDSSSSVAVGATALMMSGAITLPSQIDLPWIQPPKEVAELAGVRDDLPASYADGCHLLGYRQQKVKTECVYGDPDGEQDSHAHRRLPCSAVDAGTRHLCATEGLAPGGP